MTAVTGDDFEGLGSNLGGDRLSVTTTAESSTSTEPSTTPGEKQITTQPATTSKIPTIESILQLNQLEENLADIPRLAWEDTHRILDLNSQTLNANVDLQIDIGPTTKPYFEGSENALKKAINFWSKFDQPTKYWVLYYNYDDKAWAKEQLLQSPIFSNIEGSADALVEAPCTDTICTGANSGIESSSVGVGVYGIHQPDSRDTYRHGPLQIHEFTHSVQAAPWIGDDHPTEGPQRNGPCWLSEGQAQFAGLTVGTESYEEYLKLRNEDIWNSLFSPNPRVPSFNDFSTPKIIEYYDNNVPWECQGKRTDPSSTRNDDYELGYSIGFLTVEALSVLGGGDSSMHLYSLLGQGKTFDEAVELIYGHKWSEAKQSIASVVSSMILDIELQQEQLTEAKTQLGEKKETTTTSDTLERITIGLPFDPKNPPNGLQPMGETINHEAEYGGHPGIDFQWIADEPPKLYASAKGIIVEIIEEPPDWTLTLSHTGFDREYYTRYGLGSYDTSLEIGDEVEKSMFLGHVPSPHPEYNMYGTHWEFGFACLGEQCNYGFHGDRLCPMTYFDEDSRTVMETTWASADYDAKDQFPHICSGFYYEKDG